MPCTILFIASLVESSISSLLQTYPLTPDADELPRDRSHRFDVIDVEMQMALDILELVETDNMVTKIHRGSTCQMKNYIINRPFALKKSFKLASILTFLQNAASIGSCRSFHCSSTSR